MCGLLTRTHNTREYPTAYLRGANKPVDQQEQHAQREKQPDPVAREEEVEHKLAPAWARDAEKSLTETRSWCRRAGIEQSRRELRAHLEGVGVCVCMRVCVWPAPFVSTARTWTKAAGRAEREGARVTLKTQHQATRGVS